MEARPLLVLLVGVASTACAREANAPASAPWFREVAAEAEIDFVHRSGHREGRFWIPEVVAGGVALLDADDDGWLDVYLVQSGSLDGRREENPGNRLYRNRGDGRFTDVSAASGADDRGYGMGAATGDFDDDGRIDLYVTNVGPNVLLRNEGGATFRDVTETAGVGDPGFGSSAAFVDVDRDGDLDLFVANYLVWSPATERECFDALGRRDYCAPARYNAPALDVLYRNEGDGTFRDVSREAGITAAFGPGLGVVCGDFTGDGWVDIFVSNDGRPNQMWVNSGAGHFEDRALVLGCAMDQDGVPKAGMGIAVGDVDDDGDLDLLVGNLRRESDSFYRNEGGTFADATAGSGLWQHGRNFTRFGAGWADFDCDGSLDLFQADGRVSSEENPNSSEDVLAEPDLLYRGLGGGRFEEATLTAPPLVRAGRGTAFGDLDNDGGVDIVVANKDAAPHVLRNVCPDRGHWILVRVLDEHGRDALGASLSLSLGARRLRRDVRTASSYASGSDPRVHFGLGTATRVEDLDVRWTDGSVERFEVPGIDRVLVVRRGAGRPSPASRRDLEPR